MNNIFVCSEPLQSLQTLYDNLWQQASPKLRQNSCELDTQLGTPGDTRRGLSLLSYLHSASQAHHTSPLQQRLQGFMQALRQLEPEQYYYPPQDQHMTLLSLVSCVAGFTLNAEQAAAYGEALAAFAEKHRKTLAPIAIEFTGISLSPACVILQGFFPQDSLNRLRDQLRQHFAQCDLHTSIDSRYTLLTAHVTLVRFTQPLRQPAQFAELLQNYRHYHFGQHNINELKLVFNNWYQQQAITRQLGALRLGA